MYQEVDVFIEDEIKANIELLKNITESIRTRQEYFFDDYVQMLFEAPEEFDDGTTVVSLMHSGRCVLKVGAIGKENDGIYMLSKRVLDILPILQKLSLRSKVDKLDKQIFTTKYKNRKLRKEVKDACKEKSTELSNKENS